MKILIADDSNLVRSALKEFLLSINHDVIETNNGLDAIKLYKANNPDLVILDILMPELDGISAMQEILSLESQAKVIILTSMGQQSKIIEGIQKGAMDYIVKPFEPTKVLASIEKLSSVK